MPRPPRKQPPHRPHGGATPRAPQSKAPPPSDLIKVGGLPAVQALFKSGAERVERLFFDDRMKAKVGDLCQAMAQMRRPFRLVPQEELAKIAGSAMHGGVVAVVRPRPVPDFDPLLAQDWARSGQPLVVLDGVGNPHNLGAIVRTMAFFGLNHLLISDHPGQAAPSEAAYRVAEGGMEYVTIHRARSLPRVLKLLRPHYRVIGTALGRGEPLEQQLRSKTPIALVLGNEEEGMPAATQAACDEVVTIQGSGLVQSLNVSATAAILLHELARG